MKYRRVAEFSSNRRRCFFVMTSLGLSCLIMMMIIIMPCQGTTNPNNDDEAVFFLLDTDHDDDKALYQDVFRMLQQQDETTRVNIFQKLRESIGLALIGLLLICVAPCVIWKNEGRHVRELARITYCQNEAVVVQDVTSPTPEMNQCLVHFTGMVQVDDEQEQDNKKDDPDKLHVTSPIPHALVVKRTVYIYQKFERAQQAVQQDRLGGGETRTTTYTVQQEWTALGPQVAVLEHVPTETNTRGRWDDLVQATGTKTTHHKTSDTTLSPQQVQVQTQLQQMLGMHDVNAPPHRQVIATTARVGGFALSQDIVVAHPKAFLSNWQPVPTEYLPDEIDGFIKGSDNILRTYQEDENGPQNGDIKIVYEYIPDGFDCSFLVQQVMVASTGVDDVEKGKFGVAQCHAVQDHCLGAFSTDLGDVWMVQKGVHDVSTMIDMAKQEEAAMNKVIRIVGWILLLAGWIMLFSPFTTALQVLPILANLGYFAVVLVALIVSVLCCGTITLLAYFRYRPLLSALLLAVVGGIWAIVIWKLDEAAEEGGSVD